MTRGTDDRRYRAGWWRGVAATALLVGTLAGGVARPVAAEPANPLPCTVTSADDSGAGTLREKLADYQCGPISFDLTAMGSSTISLLSGELTINRSVSIIGPGMNALTISGRHALRVFGVSAGSIVTIKDLTIRDGNGLNSPYGGGVLSAADRLTLENVTIEDNQNVHTGGGVANAGSGDLIVLNSLIKDNVATNGGGIANVGSGNLYVIQSAIVNNAALPNNNIHGLSTMGMASSGGGIYNEQNADTTIINSTISGNSALQGGGIFNNEYQGAFAVEVYLSTITNNSAVGIGGGIYTDDTDGNTLMILQGNIIARNTISEPNGAVDIRGVTTSYGYNVVQAGSDGFTATGDQVVADAKLAPLAVNAPGTLPTHHLLPGSPALNTLPGNLCETALLGGGLNLQVADQRGVARPQGADCDSGALEVVAGVPTLTALTPSTVPVGTGELTITLTGSNFMPYGFTVVAFGGMIYPATVYSGTELTITVPASALTAAGVIPVTVTNLAPGSGSATLPFTVTPPAATGFTLTQTFDGVGSTTATPTPDVAGVRYSAGTVVTITPQETATSHLIGWRVDGVFQGWSATLDLTMNGDHTVQAIFRAPETFADVPGGSFGSNAIAELTTRGIIQGYEDGSFGAGNFVLRAQIAALVGRAMGTDNASGPGVGPATWATEDHGNTFTDRNGVDDELWRAVGSLAFHDVARGYPNGTYDPTGTVSHAQAISLITRAMVAKGYWVEQQDDPTIYTAIPADSGHRIDVATFVHYAGALPLTNTTDRYDGPNGWDQAATRAWVAEALWDALTNYHPIDRVP